ncbi:MAG: 3-dehydroquinate synthase [Candidatus Eisenbacteria bacterium]|uniref:3-dehydroquinate synthase n=1 Tax=Eiseniibacteriota bacterium TaxID=2212470 RepID=A0A849SDB4_UNCEI|nr:3-dehydroquinate synthase [Candidatus Eisenbacteria bacterium]
MSSRVVIARGALDLLGRRIRRELPGARRVAVVSDRNVARLYAPRALRTLRHAGLEPELHVLPAGETTKRVASLERLWRGFADQDLGRGDVVVALGGGVIGDLAGFAAATWLRGVAWVGVPTSLLAQVDSSIGGKTGVDQPAGKNLVGAFHQPVLVVVDPALLATLPVRHLRAGLAEVVKLGMAVDAALFRSCERSLDPLTRREPAALTRVIERAIRIKQRVVRSDERERPGGPRTALNFGHTLGHAYEAARDFRGILHGEAVAIGMRFAAALSEHTLGLAPSQRARLERLLDRLKLPRRLRGVRVAALDAAMRLDKKRAGSEPLWVLTPKIGHASVPRPVERRLLKETLVSFGAEN